MMKDVMMTMNHVDTMATRIASLRNDVKYAVHYGVQGDMCLGLMFCYPIDLTVEGPDAIQKARLDQETRAGRLMQWARR